MTNKNNNKRLLAEMRNGLGSMKRQSIMESIFFDDDQHEDFGEETANVPKQSQIQSVKPGISDTMKQIRILVIDGLKNLADNPSSIEYDTLKKILFICDKPMEKKDNETEK